MGGTFAEVNTGPIKTWRSKPRIILVDDEEWFLDFAEMLIHKYYPEADLLKFTNRNEAWGELSGTEPDLLITDLLHENIPGRIEPAEGYARINGFEMLRLLAAKKVRYPILVISGCLSMSGMEGWAKQCAGPNLKTYYLTKPFTEDLFYMGLRKCLGQVPEI